MKHIEKSSLQKFCNEEPNKLVANIHIKCVFAILANGEKSKGPGNPIKETSTASLNGGNRRRALAGVSYVARKGKIKNYPIHKYEI